MNKCCECEKDGSVLLGPKDHQSPYCEEHAREAIKWRQRDAHKRYSEEWDDLQLTLEQAIAAASSL